MRLPKSVAWETSRGGKLFPHLYDSLPLAAVSRMWRVTLGADGRYVLPPSFT